MPATLADTKTLDFRKAVLQWIEEVSGTLDEDKLNELRDLIGGPTSRQRLMYMHLVSPSPNSGCISCTIFEPDVEHRPAISADNEIPYRSVVEALADGWHVLQAPDTRSPFDDYELDILGYQFILHRTDEK